VQKTRTHALIQILFLVLAISAPATAQSTGRVRQPVLTTDDAVRAALDRLSARSARWRKAMDSVATLGRGILVVTAAEVVVQDPKDARRTESFDSSLLAEVSPLVKPDGSVDFVMVVVNVQLLEAAHRRIGSPANDLDADLERILVHEIYGHAVPYLFAGHVRGRCPDPYPGQHPADACSIRRENQIRKEAGLGLRHDYALGGLALGHAR
jgi:hypothetical protein